MSVHPTAIVDPRAELGEGVEIGPYVIIEGEVRVGAGTRVLAHAHLSGDLEIGPGCEVHMGAVLGHLPQDRKIEGEGGGLTIGPRNLFREYVTIHRSSKPGKRSRIGEGNFFLACSHAGHDCHLGDGSTIANGVLLAGHVTIGDRAFISGNVVIHQFVKIGDLAMIGGLARVSKDVPPYMLVEGNSKVRGINVVGMRRAGMSAEQRQTVKELFRLLYFSGLNVPNAIARIRELPSSPEVDSLLSFIEQSERGLCPAGLLHRHA